MLNQINLRFVPNSSEFSTFESFFFFLTALVAEDLIYSWMF